jgi:hypothetical protein
MNEDLFLADPSDQIISAKLESLNLITGPRVKEVFDEYFSDILTKEITKHSDFVKEMWDRYPEGGQPVTNGKVFEGLLATVLYLNKVLPLYQQPKLAFVPNVEFDFVAYSRESGPIVLSAKTSLRERYKQADLEGMMLRQVHRKAKSFLITLNVGEAKRVNEKIDEGKVLGLDRVVVATNPQFDELLEELKTYSYYEPEPVPMIRSPESKIIRAS